MPNSPELFAPPPPALLDAPAWLDPLPPPPSEAVLAVGAAEVSGAGLPSKFHSLFFAATLCTGGVRAAFARRTTFFFVVTGLTAATVLTGTGVLVAAAYTVGTGVLTGFGGRWCRLAATALGAGLCASMCATIGGAGSAPVAMHAAPAPTLPRHTPTSVAAGPKRPLEAAYMRSPRSA